MELSVFLAQVMGLYFLIAASTAVVARKRMQALIQGFDDNVAVAYLAGVLVVVLGLLLVLSHNVWTTDWRVIITLVAWLTLLKGIALMLWPDQVAKLGSSMSGSGLVIPTTIAVGVGAYLVYVGFAS